MCFLATVRILLAVAQRHGADTPESLETLTKEDKRGTFREETTKGPENRERKRRKPIFLRILTQKLKENSRFQALNRKFMLLSLFSYSFLVWT